MLNNTCPDSDGQTAQSLALTRWTRRDLFFEGILDLLAGVFEVGLRLVALALIFSALVAGDLADRFLSLAAQILGLILRLIRTAHSVSYFAGIDPGGRSLSPLGTSPAGFQNVRRVSLALGWRRQPARWPTLPTLISMRTTSTIPTP